MVLSFNFELLICLKIILQGYIYTVAAVGIILTANFFVDLQLSQKAINAGILGLVIGSFLSLCIYQ